jgi:hypothetical protein
MMIMSIVAPSFWNYRIAPKGAQYEISEWHLQAACAEPGLYVSPANVNLLHLPFTNLL